MTSSNGNISALLVLYVGNSPVSGEFPTQRPVTRSFDVFFDLRLNKRLSKQLWGWWFETLSSPLWRHCNGFQIWLADQTDYFSQSRSQCTVKTRIRICCRWLALWVGNLLVTDGFHAQIASNAENISMPCHHHVYNLCLHWCIYYICKH